MAESEPSNPRATNVLGTNDEDRFARRLADLHADLLAGRTSVAVLDETGPATTADERLARAVSCLKRLERVRQIYVQQFSAGQDLEPAEPAQGTEIPRRLGRFEIEREVGRGGQSVVFLARDPILGRAVALKMPRPEVLLTPAMRARFLREGRASSALKHPNLLTVYEAGEIGPVTYLAQAYCSGPTLARWLQGRSEPVPCRTAASIVVELAAGMAHAHARGVLHRDLKPSNVLLEPREPASGDSSADGAAGSLAASGGAGSPVDFPFTPQIGDFGLAKLLDEAGEATASGTLLGTLAYMAPEQAAGQSATIGRAADIYGLGAILYEILVGRPPFISESLTETLRQIAHDDPPRPVKLRADVPRDLEAICLKCLEKTPARRYAGAQQLADDLGRYLRGEPTLARPIGPLESSLKWVRRHPAQCIGLLLALTLLASGTWGNRAYHRHQAVLAREAETARRHEAESIHERYPREAQAAHTAIRRLDYDQARKHLRRCEPVLSDAEPSGFVWNFLRSQATPEHRVLSGHRGNVYALGYAPDGAWLASAGADGTLRIWGVHEGKLLATLKGHEGEINALSVSPDGRWIATAGDDHAVRIWDAAKRAQEVVLSEATDSVGSVAFSPDGQQLATGSHDKLLRVYETTNWKLVFEQTGHSDWIESLAFASPNQYLRSSDVQGKVNIWQTEPWKLQHEAPEAGQRRHVYSHRSRDSAYVVSGNLIHCYDDARNETRGEYVGHRERINALAFTADDSTLVSASRDATLRLWQVTTQACRLTMDLESGEVWSVTASPTNRQCAAGCADGSIHLLSLEGLYDRRRLGGLPAPIEATAMDGPGRVLVTATNEAEIFVWDTSTWDLLHTVHGPTGHVRGLTLSRDGQSIAAMVDDSQDGIVVLHDLKTGAHTERRVTRSQVGRIYFIDEDQRLLVVHENGVACLTKNLESTDGPVPEAVEGIYTSTLSGGGHLLALGLEDGTVRLFDLDQPHRLTKFEGLRDALHAVAVSPDLRLIAGGDGKGRVAIWDVKTRAELVDFEAHAGTVHHLAFHPDGLELASIGSDGHCRIWRVPDGSLLLSLDAGQPIGDGVLFSPDGRRLIATAHANRDVGSVYIWSASPRGGEAFPVVPSGINDVPVSEATRKLASWHRDRHDSTPSIDWFMRYLQWWAVEQGFGAAIPTYRYSGVDGMLLTEVVLIHREHVHHDLTQPENAKIDQGRDFPEMNRHADVWAQDHGATGGWLDFGMTRLAPHPDWHFALLDSAAVERRDVPVRELEGMDSSPRHRMRSLSAWAIRQGYLGAFPTWQDREEGGQQLLGALCIKPAAGERSWFVIGE